MKKTQMKKKMTIFIFQEILANLWNVSFVSEAVIYKQTNCQINELCNVTLSYPLANVSQHPLKQNTRICSRET